jgi:F0F1-type ATP synthase membrane subunit c/vacuolar-type H+-ATPase subunit K
MELILFAILTLGLPIVGVMITTIAVQRYAGPAIDKLKMEDMKWEEKAPKVLTQVNIFRSMPAVGVVFGILIFQFYLTSNYQLSGDIESQVFYSAGMMTGFSSFFMCIGMAIFYKEALPEIVEDSNKFGKYLVLASLPITGAIFGLMASILLFIGIGIIGGSPDAIIAENDANSILNSAIIFSILNVSSIFKGYLPTLNREKIKTIDWETIEKTRKAGMTGKYDQNINPDPVFSKKMILTVIPETGLFIGLLIVILNYVTLGIL